MTDLLHSLYEAASPLDLSAVARSISELAGKEELNAAPSRATVYRVLSGSALHRNQEDVVVIARVLALAARQFSPALLDRVRELWQLAATWLPVGLPISELDDPFRFEVHRSIETLARTSLPDLPEYIWRRHDDELESILVAAEKDGTSRIATLIGGSSSGKTRACWEAVKKLPPSWRVWHPFNPSRADALLDGLDNVAPRTVVWLNELQHYLLARNTGHSEKVAARLKGVVTDRRRGPVVILATLWPEYWDQLIRLPDFSGRDEFSQAREVFGGSTRIVISDTFDEETVSHLRISDEVDPRIREAALNAPHGQLTQYLAGSLALLDRYVAAPLAPRALIDAAIDLRRIGQGSALASDLLRDAAVTYMDDSEWSAVRRNQDWYEHALEYVEKLCHGLIAPLIRVWPRPGEEDPGTPRYRLAEYLEQIGLASRRREPFPPLIWGVLRRHIRDPIDAARIGDHARALHRYDEAIPFLELAADAQIDSAQVGLANIYRDLGDVQSLRTRATAGDQRAIERLADLLIDEQAANGILSAIRPAMDSGDLGLVARILRVLTDQQGLATGRDDVELPPESIDTIQDAIAQLKGRAISGVAELEICKFFFQTHDRDALLARATGNTKSHAWFYYLQLLALEDDIESLRQLADRGDRAAESRMLDCLAERGDDVTLKANRHRPGADERIATLLFRRRDVTGLVQLASQGFQGANQALLTIGIRDADIPVLRDRVNAGVASAEKALVDVLARLGDIEGLRYELTRGNLYAGQILLRLKDAARK